MGKTSSGEVRRSGSPKDLRTDGPSGEVQKYWQPESFEWFGGEAQGRRTGLFVRISKTQLRVSHSAAEAAGVEPGDKVKVGINKAYLAIKKDEWGMATRPDGNKTTKAFYISASALMKQLLEKGWPANITLPCVWDTKSKMLVVRKPPRGGAKVG